MDRFPLYQNSFAIHLASDNGQLKIQIELEDAQAKALEFPVQISLLRSVIRGFSYQIASPVGTLNLAQTDPNVVFTAHLNSQAPLTAKIDREKFSKCVEGLGE